MNIKKAETSGNIPVNAPKDSSDICDLVLQDRWNYQIIGKQYFPENLTLLLMSYF